MIHGLLEAVSYFVSEPTRLIILLIFFLLFLTVMLTVYIIYLRFKIGRRNRYLKKKHGEWQTLLLEYLSGDTAFSHIASIINKSDFEYFSDYISRFFTSIKGEDFLKLVILVNEIGLVNYYVKKLKKGNKWQKVHAAFFLGLIHEKKVIPDLIDGLNDKHYMVSFACAQGLASMGDKEHLLEILNVLTQREDWSEDKVAEIILELGPDTGDDLLELLKQANLETHRKYLLVELLGFFKHLPALKLLTLMLTETEDDELKIKIIKSLGDLSSPTSLSVLEAHLDYGNWRIRSETVKSLGKIGDEKMAQPLKEKMSDENWWVRYNAALSLSHIGKTGIDLLKAASQKKRKDPAKEISLQVLSEIELG